MSSVDGTHSGTRLKKSKLVMLRRANAAFRVNHSEDDEYSVIYLSQCGLLILETNYFPILGS